MPPFSSEKKRNKKAGIKATCRVLWRIATCMHSIVHTQDSQQSTKLYGTFLLVNYISFELSLCNSGVYVCQCAYRFRCKLGYHLNNLIFLLLSPWWSWQTRVCPCMFLVSFDEGEREECAFQAPNLREEHPQGQARKRFRSLRFQRKVLISLIAICQTTVTISQESSSICWPERVLTLLHSILAAKPRQRNTDHLASKANHK